MDIQGNDLQLTLTELMIVSSGELTVVGMAVPAPYYIVFRFTTSGTTHTVLAVIPVVFSSSTNGAVIDVNYLSNGKFAKFLTSP